MDKEYLKHVLDIRSLVVFASLKEDPVIGGLCRLLQALSGASHKGNDPVELIELYAEITKNLYPVTSDLGDYIRRAVLADDNFYVEAVACGDDISDEIQDTVKRELLNLQELSGLSSRQIRGAVVEILSKDGEDPDPSIRSAADNLPSWKNGESNLLRDFMNKLNDLDRTGYGIFADNDFFRVTDEGILPVSHPDVQPLSELFGYSRQKEQIIRNTEALLSGHPASGRDGAAASRASNILLYGDAGTGKSSTVKAIALQYASEGLRLIEIKKEQLHLIPSILDEISRQPLKFILFVDDLSFSGNDDNFSALKATLEGSITGRGDNAVIYATSNRRHLVRETHSDREGDELHINDTLQETMSLAARFGLTIMFENPDKDGYLEIVRELARLNGIDMDEDELFRKAESHAIRRNGRSPRTAKQFVELLKVELIR